MKGDMHVTRCEKYDPTVLRNRIGEHLERYPEFRELGGKKVLLKINLLSASDPEKGVTTNPEFVKAVVLEIERRGGKCIIGDSPGGLFNSVVLKRAYKKTGMDDVAGSTGAELNIDTDYHEENHLGGQFIKKFNICSYIRTADLTIAMPKLKTHMFQGLTCCSKIMFGAIPGLEKVQYHARFPDQLDFSRMLVDLTDLTRPDLFLVDGIVGMDGEGPSQGRVRKVGLILSGKDHSRMDLAVCDMVGLDPWKIPALITAREYRRIHPDMAFSISGDGADFRLEEPFIPANSYGIIRNPPRFLKRMAINLTNDKPKIDRKRCVGCGVCRDNCAGSAIIIKDGKAVIDHSKCIRCYCCHELCPYDAVKLARRPFFTKTLKKLILKGVELGKL